jgi:hypothetical protein
VFPVRYELNLYASCKVSSVFNDIQIIKNINTVELGYNVIKGT